ncbi:MAG: response regulator transcription factor [Acidobacteria bacterium]|nr:response regulator transcription factor [Acidobacteriota bacterium]
MNVESEVSEQTSVSDKTSSRPRERILVAEDDIALAHCLQKGLARENLLIDLVHDGLSAWQAAQVDQYDLLILDLNLPLLDGLSLLRKLRPLRPHLPVLVLTGLSGIEDRVQVLDSGADDFLSKPFSLFELGARVRALLRRVRGNPGRTICVSDMFMDRDQQRVERCGKRIPLSSKEFAVLECLMANAGKPVTRSMIMESAWGTPYDGATNLVDVYVKYVRDKVDGGATEKLIHTVRGIGYVVAQDRNPVLAPPPHRTEPEALALSGD